MHRSKLAVICTVIAAGCTAQSTVVPDDTAHVLQALVATLTADKKPVCLDDKTYGDPLAIYRTMMTLPAGSRPTLLWHAPSPLRPPVEPSGQRVFNGEIRSDQIFLARPVQNAAILPAQLQHELDVAAQRLALITDNPPRKIAQWTGAPLATPRWWVLNRLTPSCSPRYTISHPVVAKDLAFVAVTAGHWGTVYAFNKRGKDWATLGQWSNWLY